jgi:hypothetical protein
MVHKIQARGDTSALFPFYHANIQSLFVLQLLFRTLNICITSRLNMPSISRQASIRIAVLVTSCIAASLIISQLSLIQSYADQLPRVSTHPAIPNIVHYTQLQKNEHSTLHFSFESFLSLYAALRILKPSKIYIHTNFNESMLTEAAQNGSKWTRMVLTSFKEVVINQVQVPEEVNGLTVENIEAKSDFVRWEEVYDKGGIYLDWDVHTLRDVKILRKSGFNNVVGQQPEGPVNTGCFMSARKSALATLMKREQYVVFDNSWEAHSVNLLTDISRRLVRSPGEVLIMESPAFAPFNWRADDMDNLMAPHKDAPASLAAQVNDPVQDPFMRWDKKVTGRDWEHDFSASYFLHAFKTRDHHVPGYKGVSVRYVLDRDSNFALATWPVVELGVKEGILSPDDDEV